MAGVQQLTDELNFAGSFLLAAEKNPIKSEYFLTRRP